VSSRTPEPADRGYVEVQVVAPKAMLQRLRDLAVRQEIAAGHSIVASLKYLITSDYVKSFDVPGRRDDRLSLRLPLEVDELLTRFCRRHKYPRPMVLRAAVSHACKLLAAKVATQ